MSIEEIIASLCDGCEHAPGTCDVPECRKRSIGFRVANMEDRIRFLEAALDRKDKRLAAVTAERDALCAQQEPPNEPLTPERFEEICEEVHNGWWLEKVRQGVTGHPDMVPYQELSEDTKEYDRVTVSRVLDALGIDYPYKP